MAAVEIAGEKAAAPALGADLVDALLDAGAPAGRSRTWSRRSPSPIRPWPRRTSACRRSWSSVPSRTAAVHGLVADDALDDVVGPRRRRVVGREHRRAEQVEEDEARRVVAGRRIGHVLADQMRVAAEHQVDLDLGVAAVAGHAAVLLRLAPEQRGLGEPDLLGRGTDQLGERLGGVEEGRPNVEDVEMIGPDLADEERIGGEVAVGKHRLRAAARAFAFDPLAAACGSSAANCRAYQLCASSSGTKDGCSRSSRPATASAAWRRPRAAAGGRVSRPVRRRRPQKPGVAERA